MNNKEAIYDEKIAPLVNEILALCKEHEIPMFATFQYSDVYKAYEAGEKAERDRWVAQSRMVRNRSNPDDLFEATPLAVMCCENA